MDPDGEVDFDMSPFVVRYKSGRVHRLIGAPTVNAGTDTATGVTCKDVVIDASTGLAARLFIPTDILVSTPTTTRLPVLIYFHGGGFVVHSAFSAVYTRFVNALVSAARVVAVSVEYRLAPENPLPAAYDDAWTALRWAAAAAAEQTGDREGEEPWLAAHGDAARLFVAGDSAGGNIAHNVAVAAGKKSGGRGGGGLLLPGGTRIEGMVLLHPYFAGKELLPSEGDGVHPNVRHTPERVWGFLCAGRYGIDHPFINPLGMPAADWAALPCRRVLVTVAEHDYLRDRGRRYVEALRGGVWAGEVAALYETEGEDHIYFLEKEKDHNSRQQDKADKEMAAIASFLMASSSTEATTLRRPSPSAVRSLRFDPKL